ncbi:SDR family oxidoreductase [Aliiglaciecola lipolytica]|uniref:SDR family oxidoreductase n=1 Tax=Aliiglaciecola lipolytica TaxID=477689 RepID=UPI001C09EA5F|nr:SDR family oxidoreductase [Aliiglaciecola lipolytica]
MKIAIIGAGWLGLPLAQALTQSGHSIVATKRSASDVKKLQDMGVSAFQYALGDNLNSPELGNLFDVQTLILNIPPGRKSPSLTEYTNQMQALVTTAKQKGVQKVIFISTTAVYGNRDGIIYEYSPVAPHTNSGKAHVEIENWIRDLFQQNACILRLAGLVSQDRHPVRSLSGRKNIENGQQAINLVHREDVISAIQKIITNNKFGQTYHLSSVEHPTRQQYYTDAATSLGLPPPEFTPVTSAPSGKRINCDLTINALELTLAYPSPYDML